MAAFDNRGNTSQNSNLDETSEGLLTNNHFVQLGRAIVPREMESIALEYLQIDEVKIESLISQKGATEAFNREILRIWSNKHPGRDK